MRIFSEQAKGNPGRLILELCVGLTILALFATCLWPINVNDKYSAKRAACTSNLKQLGTAVLIYESDNDESLPIWFTFDGAKQTDQFIEATKPYLKNLDMLVCPSDFTALKESPDPTALVGDKHKMSYVHCLSLKGIIPDFNNGSRYLKLKGTNLNLEQTAYMREPIRSYGNPTGDQTGPTYLSAHQRYPIVAYLDSHVSGKKPIEITREL